MAFTRKERLQRSVGALERLHGFMASFALTIAARTFLEEWLKAPSTGFAGAVSTFPKEPFNLFVASIVTLIPFFHGAVRHLDETHLYSSNPPRYGFPIDFLFLFVESVLFGFLGLSVNHPEHFIIGLVALIIVDTAWGGITRAIATDPAVRSHINKWLALNIATMTGIALITNLAKLSDWSFFLAWGAIVRTAVDYAWNFRFFFYMTRPDELAPSSASS